MPIDNVLDVTPRVQYVASASQTAFDYPFAIFADADLVVIVDGVTKTLTTHYTVSGEGDDTGGTVTFLTGQTAGAIVTIYRDIAIERTSDFQTNGPLSSATFNDELDRLTLVQQELEAKVGRSIRLPFDAEVTDAELELNVANFEGKYITIEGGVPTPATLSAETMTQSTIGELLNPITAAETAAGVTPDAYQYPSIEIIDRVVLRRYGIAPGSTDWGADLLLVVDMLDERGGGEIIFPTGTTMSSLPIPFRNNISYSGCGGSIVKSHASNVSNLFGEETPAAAYTYIKMRDLILDGNSANCAFPADDAAGNVLRLNQVSFSDFSNVYIRNSVFNAVSVYNNSNDNKFVNFDIADVGKSGTLPAVYTFCGFFFEAGSSRNKVLIPKINVTRQYGIWIGARDADNYDNEIIQPWIASTTGDGIKIGDEATANVCYRPKIVAPTVLSAGDVGIRVYHAGTGAVVDAEIQGGLVQGCTNAGVSIGALADRTRVLGTRLKSNGAYNFANAGSNTTFDVDASGATTADILDTGTVTRFLGTANVADGRQGTFSPSVLFGGANTGLTYADRAGSYRVNGNRIYFTINISLSAKGSSTGTLTIGGLPFAKGTTATGPMEVAVANLTYAGQIRSLVLNSATAVTLYSQATGSALTALTDAAVANDTEFYISGEYEIA